MPRDDKDCDLPEILGVRAREILFPARAERVAVELTVTGRNLPCGGLPTTVRVGEQRLLNLEWLDQNTLRGVLTNPVERSTTIQLELDHHPIAEAADLDPASIERL